MVIVSTTTRPDLTGNLPALVAMALDLGAEQVAGLSGAERELAALADPAAAGRPAAAVEAIRARVAAGEDPLGDALTATRAAA
jgi:hypothetical protein